MSRPGTDPRGRPPGRTPGTHAATGARAGVPTGPVGRRAAVADWWAQARSDPGWLLLPLRLFLGVTFTKAGVDKLSDRAFFDPSDPTSITGQIAAFRQTSPLRPLLGIAADHANTVGVLMALGEIAVGLATLLGVRVRLAAIGGALISLSLLLTVTWQTRPYYYGSDIVFLFSWLPLIGYGSGTVLSLQQAAARRWARPGSGPAGTRRALLAQLGVAGLATVATALVARLARGGASRPAQAGSTPSPTGSGSAAAGSGMARAADVPVGQVLPVTLPGGVAGYLVHVQANTFVAFNRTCTHAGCQVALSTDRREFDCPCHQSRFAADTGAVLSGPAPRPLDQVPVEVVDGEVRSKS